MKYFKIIAILLLVAFILSCNTRPTRDGMTGYHDFYPISLIIGFYEHGINTKYGDIIISKNNDGIIHIGHDFFDYISNKYNFVYMRRFRDFQLHPNWIILEGVYALNFFRVLLNTDDIIDYFRAARALVENEEVFHASVMTMGEHLTYHK
jgi:hypothetical protein